MVTKPGSSESGHRWGPVDIGAAAAVLLAAAGVVWSPKLSNSVASATGQLTPVTVLVDVRGVPVADPAALIRAVDDSGSVSMVIRNQPHGSVRVRAVRPLQRQLVALQPDGRVITAPDPNQQFFSTLDARFELAGQGRRTGGGVVFGNQSLKIGAPVELEGRNFRVTGTVTGLQVGA